MSRVEPGETFSIQYGNGHSIEVMALNMRQKGKLIAIVEQVSGLAESNQSRAKLFELAEQALKICVPNVDESTLDTLDEQMAMEIITATLSGQFVSDDDKKKSESQPSSVAENSVSDVEAVA